MESPSVLLPSSGCPPPRRRITTTGRIKCQYLAKNPFSASSISSLLSCSVFLVNCGLYTKEGYWFLAWREGRSVGEVCIAVRLLTEHLKGWEGYGPSLDHPVIQIKNREMSLSEGRIRGQGASLCHSHDHAHFPSYLHGGESSILGLVLYLCGDISLNSGIHVKDLSWREREREEEKKRGQLSRAFPLCRRPSTKGSSLTVLIEVEIYMSDHLFCFLTRYQRTDGVGSIMVS